MNNYPSFSLKLAQSLYFECLSSQVILNSRMLIVFIIASENDRKKPATFVTG